MKTVNDFNFEDKKALIRVDFNVPLNENLEVTDRTRIEAAKPTIVKILEDGKGGLLDLRLLGGRPDRERRQVCGRDRAVAATCGDGASHSRLRSAVRPGGRVGAALLLV